MNIKDLNVGDKILLKNSKQEAIVTGFLYDNVILYEMVIKGTTWGDGGGCGVGNVLDKVPTTKTLFYLVESNRDLSVHCSTLHEALLIMEADFDVVYDITNPIQCTITQVWLTDEEIENMHEAD